MVLRCCTLWWKQVGVDGLFSGRDQLLEAVISDGVKVVTLLSFQYSSAAMTWCFDDFTLLDTSACSRNVLFAFTSFNPAVFPITDNLDVSYWVTPLGRHLLLDFVPYQINSHAPEGCSFLWFGSEVDIMLVSISKMKQENKRVSVITHQYCFTGV